MELRLPFATPPDLDDFDDLPPDLDELGLDEVLLARPGSAKANTAPAATKSGARGLRQALTKEPGMKVPDISRELPPPPPRGPKSVILSAQHQPLPLPTERKRVTCKPPAPSVTPRSLEVFDELLPDIDGFEEWPPAIDAVGLGEVVPRPAATKPNVTPAAAKSDTRELRQGRTKASGKQVVKRVRCKPSPPPLQKKRIIRRVPGKPSPPPVEKKVFLRVWRKPSPPSAEKKVVKRGWCRPPPSPAEKKTIVLQSWRRQPPPTVEKKKIIWRVAPTPSAVLQL
jgi:hypothetical protein